MLGPLEDDEQLEGELEDGLRGRLAGGDPDVHPRHPGRLAEEERRLRRREGDLAGAEESVPSGSSQKVRAGLVWLGDKLKIRAWLGLGSKGFGISELS